MSTDFSIRPVGVPVALPVVRATSDTTSRAVRTELPAPQSTTQPTGVIAIRSHQQPPAAEPQTSQAVVIDRAANSIVYQTINQQTGQIVSQFPNTAVLQARAYYRALAELQANSGLYNQIA